MDYISDFYTNVHKSIREARKFVQFFTTDEKILSHTIGSFWKRSTLLNEMERYTQKRNVFLDIVGEVNPEKIEQHFKKTAHTLEVKHLPNTSFTKPLTDFMDAFIIIDRQTVYILPDKKQPHGLRITQAENVAMLSFIFNQLLKEGQALWMNKVKSFLRRKNTEKNDKSVLDIKNLPQMINPQHITSNNTIKNIQLSQQLRRER